MRANSVGTVCNYHEKNGLKIYRENRPVGDRRIFVHNERRRKGDPCITPAFVPLRRDYGVASSLGRRTVGFPAIAGCGATNPRIEPRNTCPRMARMSADT